MQLSASWSERFAQHFQLELDDSLIAWLDHEAWRLAGECEFNQPVSPEDLVYETPNVLWPGLMLPDCVPLIGNSQGDWLCLRVGKDNRTQEIIHWFHGGGDWIPWGTTIEEAIFFDSFRHALPGQRSVHAIAAEPKRMGSHHCPLANWATARLPRAVSHWIDRRFAANVATSLEEALELADQNIASVAIRCELAIWALDSPFRKRMTPELAARFGVDWEPTAMEWVFDHGRIPKDAMDAIQRKVPPDTCFTQDWPLATEQAERILRGRSDLGWAWDVLAWRKEQLGERSEALGLYLDSTLASAFADQSVRFRTHWFPTSAGKFSSWRASELLASGVFLQTPTPAQQLAQDYLQTLSKSPAGSLRKTATEFWLGQADEAMRSNRPDDAYDAVYRAGWDLGAESMSEYRSLLATLVDTAKSAGQNARARVASIHLNTLTNRFG